ncbi:hypothetical protein MM221_09810 [Salipaludibacillus sp. LMS25]|jgi:hypothetical protein|uniref:hypothetical protein n=1 Tax=Salipaludibacillus sp. LMS25 TaxID=2924031 RepID=UPI0020D0D6E4|nr:hypothetical protein [Salipaludibacillus sp. LMS25]UTR16778.1 hypothetical protein MM221_09810 [Salipaludibacillus sp. LMS25]
MFSGKRIIFLFILSLFIILGACANIYNDQVGYKASQIHDQIPVPKNAEITSGEANNQKIKESVFYKLNGIGGQQGLYPPMSYIEKIEEWGWKQLKEERLGGKFTFIKEETKIWVIIDEDSFSIHILDEAE